MTPRPPDAPVLLRKDFAILLGQQAVASGRDDGLGAADARRRAHAVDIAVE